MDFMVEIEKIECCQCHLLFWVTSDHKRRLVKSKESFYCPNGHSQSYVGKSDAEKLKDKEEYCKRLQDSNARKEREKTSLRKSLISQKAHYGKLKKKLKQLDESQTKAPLLEKED